MSSFKYKFVVVYIVYGVHIQTSALILRDPKGSHLGRACGVCCITRYEERHMLYLRQLVPGAWFYSGGMTLKP
jgi:hypothetical protein